MKDLTSLLNDLAFLYGVEVGQQTFKELCLLIAQYRERISLARQVDLSQRDAILITYGDQVSQANVAPLQTLSEFCQHYLPDVISGIHILPFYPYSSDDGFSVVDYLTVDPALGSWKDITHLQKQFRLMVDAVINHISVRSAWFQEYLHGNPRYADYFIAVPDGADLSAVVRPRTLPLLTTFQVNGQPQNIWTTFSADQVDLNYHHPAVLLDVINVLLAYVARGAEFIRLDAIAFMWKTYGTSCLHLPQTHRIIQLMRAVLDQVAPHVILITETNVPHQDNLSYFGDGSNEAQLVYNFALPPLVMHTLLTGSAEILTQWASGLALPSKQATFFNFLASHDGIGLNPARGILSPTQIEALVEHARSQGGLVSYKNNPDGSTSPYELNINYFDALSDAQSAEPVELQVERFTASQAIMLSIIGVPGIYFHSLFGSRSWREGVEQTGHNRTINRQKFTATEIEAELSDPSHLRHQVFARYSHLLRLRAAQPAFNPYGEMEVLDAGRQVFAVLRSGFKGLPVLCLQNVSGQTQSINPSIISRLGFNLMRVVDLITGQFVNRGVVVLAPYQTLWLMGTEIAPSSLNG